MLRIGDSVMVLNKQTNGFLVMDMGDKITSNDEAYAVTTTPKELGPCARSIFIFDKADPKDTQTDGLVHFGQKLRLLANPHLYNKKLYLNST
jgi:hypothetical protein